MPQDLIASLAAPDVSVRVSAIASLAKDPDAARPRLVTLIQDDQAPAVARVWGMIALCQLPSDGAAAATDALLACLDAPEPIVRRSAIETLGRLGACAAVWRIADHLNDDAEVAEAWFDDDSTPAHAARRALESIGTPDALALLADAPSNAELAAIEERCNAATAGPWRSFVEGRDHSSGSDFIQTGGFSESQDIELVGATTADQDFIASAKQDVPRLIQEIRRLRRRPKS